MIKLSQFPLAPLPTTPCEMVEFKYKLESSSFEDLSVEGKGKQQTKILERKCQRKVKRYRFVIKHKKKEIPRIDGKKQCQMIQFLKRAGFQRSGN